VYQEEYKEYVDLIAGRLSPKRFVHSMNVAKAAVELTKLYGGDSKQAYLAGVLHDIMKEEKPEIQLQIIKEYDTMTDTVTLQAPPLWHAKAGAAYCASALKITDNDLLNAISYHTTGRADMSHLEKILYLADYIGEERDYEDVDIMRAETLTSMERGLKYALTYTVNDLTSRGKAVHPDTLQAYNQYGKD
jgi:nicotinate-nucleotide adenylyltransferase